MGWFSSVDRIGVPCVENGFGMGTLNCEMGPLPLVAGGRVVLGWNGRDELGQMIFNWQTPKLMSDVNVQGESSIHNLWFIHHHTRSIAAVVMSVLFCLAIIGAWGRHSGWVRSRSLADILLPVWCTASYFLSAAIIYRCVVAAKAGVDFEFFRNVNRASAFLDVNCEK